MSERIDHHRRRAFAALATTVADARLDLIGAVQAQPNPARPGSLPANRPGTHSRFGPLKQIDAGVLRVGYVEAGPANGPAVILLHGWPYDIHSYADERSAAAFDNPDHVSIVIHNYRWRLSLADGEPKYDDLEKRPAAGPLISVPTITLEGDANGAPHPNPSAYVNKFSGKHTHRLIKGAGHKLPQEAPQAFAEAVLKVAGSR